MNKAIQNLLILKQDAVHHRQSYSPESLHKLSSVKLADVIDVIGEEDASDLTVRGRASNLHFQITEQASVEQDKYDDFIEGALFLILKLEKDTRETTLKFDTVKERVCDLRRTLDIEAVRRMILLREAVQEGNTYNTGLPQ